MVDALNLGTHFSALTPPSELGKGRRGWKVLVEVVVVLLLASALIGWFAVTRNQTGSGSFLPSKQELLRRMAEKPAVSLTEVQKQTLLKAMVQPNAAPTLTTAQRADLLQKMAAGK
ncbi:MAG: hypothetical protein WCO79_03515 [bacterium]